VDERGGDRVNLNAAFVECLSQGTMSTYRPRPTSQIVLMTTIGTSETHLPPGLAIVGESFTQVSMAPQRLDGRDASSRMGSVAHQLRSSGFFKVNEEADKMVNRLFAENMPKATIRRILAPRRK
jgi:hypothetical protein